MTHTTEPTIDSLYKKIDYILSTLIVVACDYEAGKDVDLDAQANLTNHVLQALISDQVAKARIDEVSNALSLTSMDELKARYAELRSTL